jgi:3-methyladenine DNA glycosylase AlkD
MKELFDFFWNTQTKCNSGNRWLIRTAILFQLKYKDKTDEVLLFGLCKQYAGEKEFFIKKAIGWALRQYAHTRPEAVRKFVKQHTLQPLSIREAMKHL